MICGVIVFKNYDLKNLKKKKKKSGLFNSPTQFLCPLFQLSTKKRKQNMIVTCVPMFNMTKDKDGGCFGIVLCRCRDRMLGPSHRGRAAPLQVMFLPFSWPCLCGWLIPCIFSASWSFSILWFCSLLVLVQGPFFLCHVPKFFDIFYHSVAKNTIFFFFNFKFLSISLMMNSNNEW